MGIIDYLSSYCHIIFLYFKTNLEHIENSIAIIVFINKLIELIIGASLV